MHRDIKPENMLLDKRGRVKIADFGLAKLLRREPLDMTLTLSGMALGTLRYMAPEQMDKPETVDHRADIYSLGVVFYEMLTGETSRWAASSRHRKKRGVDVRLDEIVLHALEREPAQRYQHASEIKTDMETVAGSVANPLHRSAPTVSTGDVWRRIGEWLMWLLVPLAFYGATTGGFNKLLPIPEPWSGPVLMVIAFGCLGYVIRYFRRPSEENSNGAPQHAASGIDRVRLSRCALFGAIWAVLGVVAIIPVLFFIGLNRVWNGTALPTDLIYERPPVEVTIFMGALLAISAGAPIGTTVLGWVAIGHIQRSGGKVVGLPLAALDVALFPVLALGGAAFGLTHLAQIALWTQVHTGYVYESGRLVDVSAPPEAAYPGMAFMVLDGLVALVVCFFAGRAAWRFLISWPANTERRIRQ